MPFMDPRLAAQARQTQALYYKGEILGYKKNYRPMQVGAEFAEVESIIKDLVLPSKVNRPSMNLKKVQTGAKRIIGKYFTIHTVPFISVKTVQSNQMNLMHSRTGAEVAQKFNSLCRTISPYEIPVNLIKGHSMVGETQKPIIVAQLPGFKENVKIPYSEVLLGDNLTDLSIATYVHELGHILTESIPGYATDFYNKEVISIFLEKLAALELDSTGTLLKISERMRFAHLYQMIKSLKKQSTLGFEQSLANSVYVNSTLLATCLFDKYQNGTLEEQKDIISSIQQVFDGQITVEDLLTAQGITLDQSKNPELIKKHI